MIEVQVTNGFEFSIYGHCDPKICCAVSSLIAAAETFGDVIAPKPGIANVKSLPDAIARYMLETLALISKKYPNEVKITLR